MKANTTNTTNDTNNIDDIDNMVITLGSHRNPGEGVCIMEWLSLKVGAPFSDRLSCVSPFLNELLIHCNDCIRDPATRQRLKEVGIKALGTRKEEKGNREHIRLDNTRHGMVVDWILRTFIVSFLNNIKVQSHKSLKDLLEGRKGPEEEITQSLHNCAGVLSHMTRIGEVNSTTMLVPIGILSEVVGYLESMRDTGYNVAECDYRSTIRVIRDDMVHIAKKGSDRTSYVATLFSFLWSLLESGVDVGITNDDFIKKLGEVIDVIEVW